MPAARLADMHICPMVTPGTPPVPHVGGPISGPCAPTVLIGFMPAARLTDMAVCVGPPDAIVTGSPTVVTSYQPQARVLDPCAHGGMISVGCPTVIVGDSGSGSGGSGGGFGLGTLGNIEAPVTPAQAVAIAAALKEGGYASIPASDSNRLSISLVHAANHGIPFCEVCYRSAKARGASEEEAQAIGRTGGRGAA
jgi:uncharacterized Zn-binding protein involved in type VI secretion